MTPSNTSNGNPFVYDVQDAQGVKHQIVPVDHTHPLSEISDYPGSESTPTLGSSKLVTSGGVYSALQYKASLAQLAGKEDKPLPLGMHCNDDPAELYPDDNSELHNIITGVEAKLIASTSNPKPVHVLIVLSYFDSHGNFSYKFAVNGEMAIWTNGNDVHLSIIIGGGIYVMNGTYSIIEVQGQQECTVTISDATFYYEYSI